MPEFPDESLPVLEVEIYYTQQAEFPNIHDKRAIRNDRKNRFWNYACQANRKGLAELPLMHDDKELRAYANMRYQLDEPYTGAGYYYGIYTVNEFNFLLQFKLPKQKGFRK